jgi:hypothetical protein
MLRVERRRRIDGWANCAWHFHHFGHLDGSFELNRLSLLWGDTLNSLQNVYNISHQNSGLCNTRHKHSGIHQTSGRAVGQITMFGAQ